MSKLIKAPQIDNYVDWLGRVGYTSHDSAFTYDPKSYELLDELFLWIRKFAPTKDKELHSLWLCSDIGTIEDFGNYEEMYSINGLSHFIEKLLTVEPISSDDDVVINTVRYGVDINDPFEDTSVYRIEDILKYYEPISEYDELDDVDLDSLDDNDIDSLFKVFERIYNKCEGYDQENKTYSYPSCVRGYSYEFCEWEKILGWLVPDHIPGSDDECGFAAVILKEMTFFGFEEKDMIAEREKLEESIDEAEKIKELPEEEQEKHYASFEELKREFGIVDERTPEEKARDEFNSRKGIALGSLFRYRAIKQVYEGLNNMEGK